MYETESPQSIQELSKSIYIPRGINTEALDRTIQWDFTPTDIRVLALHFACLTCSLAKDLGLRLEIMFLEATYSAQYMRILSLMHTRFCSTQGQWELSRI